MKPIHKKIYRIRVARATKCAKEIQGFRTVGLDDFSLSQKKALNDFYSREAITPLQARGVVIQMKPSKLFMLYQKLVSSNYGFHDFYGNYFNEKITMITMSTKRKIDYHKFVEKMQNLYKGHCAFITF